VNTGLPASAGRPILVGVRETRSHALRALAGWVALLALPAPGAAQTPLTSWDQVIPNASQRFVVLAAFNDEAVLDRETGLVWERTPADVTRDWAGAISHCYWRTVQTSARAGTGPVPGRNGWRLPTIEELSTLLAPTPGHCFTLPPGHPFQLPPSTWYWSITTVVSDSAQEPGAAAWRLLFSDTLGCQQETISGKLGSNRAWCVRGGHGYDAFH
jgi:hypothetical protein